MTKPKFYSLKVGDRVEYLDVNLARTGEVLIVLAKYQGGIKVHHRGNMRASIITNWLRVGTVREDCAGEMLCKCGFKFNRGGWRCPKCRSTELRWLTQPETALPECHQEGK